jgi:hypothetical protein
LQDASNEKIQHSPYALVSTPSLIAKQLLSVKFSNYLLGFFLPELKHPLRYGANMMKTCSQNKKNIGGSR